MVLLGGFWPAFDALRPFNLLDSGRPARLN